MRGTFKQVYRGYIGLYRLRLGLGLMGFPKIGDSFFGAPIIKFIVFGVCILATLF